MIAEMQETAIKAPRSKSILELTATEAQNFLLKPESFCSLDLPPLHPLRCVD